MEKHLLQSANKMSKKTRDPARLSLPLIPRNRSAPDFAHLTRALLPRNRSGALEISFGWLFAIIAGIAIIFIAIYMSSKLINSSQETVSAETGKEIAILLNPLETSFESAQTTSITIPSETRINNICDESGTFGRQGIRLDQKSFKKWVTTDVNVFFNNKYIFSESEIEGKKFYIFSKPFSFPFKIADLIYITSADKTYCFVEAPNEISREISNLNQSNILLESSLPEKCSDDTVKVCFNNNNCAINVDVDSRTVRKNKTTLYFSGIGEDTDPLMYAAIFSDKETYECQVKRLLSRLKEISSLYRGKIMSLQKIGCTDSLSNSLGELENMIGNSTSSENLQEIGTKAAEIDYTNSAGVCLVW
jgi:hypothetical protein